MQRSIPRMLVQIEPRIFIEFSIFTGVDGTSIWQKASAQPGNPHDLIAIRPGAEAPQLGRQWISSALL